MKSVENKRADEPRTYIFYDLVKYSAGIPGLIWFRPKIIYENDAARKRLKGGALIISNHNGFYDPIYMMYALWYRRQHFICLDDFFKSKAGWLFRQFHCIPIDRENFSMNTFRRITDALEEGKVVSMFPEGHVNVTDGKLDAFKSGMIMMVLRGAHPIIPIYVKKKKRLLERLTIMVGEPVDITAIYGPKPTFAQINELTGLLQKKEESFKQILEGDE